MATGIIGGLFSARAGIASHGSAIAVVGDNISNANTVGYKASRSEFEDLIAGGQSAGRVIGSGSSTSAVTTIFEQGSVEFTSRPLDLAIDGNGFFVVADGAQRFYTRAGNFRVDSAGFLVNQNGLAVLGFPANGTGSLEPINTNALSQDSVATTDVTISGTVPASVPELAIPIPATPPATFADLNNAAAYSTVVEVFDSLGESHTITYFYFKTDTNEYTARGYVASDDVDPVPVANPGQPRLVTDGTAGPTAGDIVMNFDGSGNRISPPVTDMTVAISWNNGSDASAIDVSMQFNQYAGTDGDVRAITQNGKGIGNVGSFQIEKDGTIFALLSNGQSAIIGRIGMANFANPEGLTRIGGNLFAQSPSSGEPVVGKPGAGTFGDVSSGSLELSTVDIASEFVKLITLQRGFQANSRIITTINQLLNEIIQLA